jgi:molybdopterin/thiamine biosynthesis adenylyltransferase
VVIVGVGALGAAAALELAAAPGGAVARVRIVDGDRVETSNLHRQMLHETGDLERPKAAVAGEKLARLSSPAVEARAERVTTVNVRETLSGMTVAIDATDDISTKFLLNDACAVAGIPLVHGGVTGFAGQVLIIVPGEGPCLRCLFPDPPSESDSATCRDGGILGPVAGFVGALQARAALEVLRGDPRPRLLRFDGRSLVLRAAEPRRVPSCPVCSHVKKRAKPGTKQDVAPGLPAAVGGAQEAKL